MLIFVFLALLVNVDENEEMNDRKRERRERRERKRWEEAMG